MCMTCKLRGRAYTSVSSPDAAAKVLAYEKDVPQQGGLVLMGNRTVKQMTAQEFQAAK